MYNQPVETINPLACPASSQFSSDFFQDFTPCPPFCWRTSTVSLQKLHFLHTENSKPFVRCKSYCWWWWKHWWTCSVGTGSIWLRFLQSLFHFDNCNHFHDLQHLFPAQNSFVHWTIYCAWKFEAKSVIYVRIVWVLNYEGIYQIFGFGWYLNWQSLELECCPIPVLASSA